MGKNKGKGKAKAQKFRVGSMLDAQRHTMFQRDIDILTPDIFQETVNTITEKAKTMEDENQLTFLLNKANSFKKKINRLAEDQTICNYFKLATICLNLAKTRHPNNYHIYLADLQLLDAYENRAPKLKLTLLSIQQRLEMRIKFSSSAKNIFSKTPVNTLLTYENDAKEINKRSKELIASLSLAKTMYLQIASDESYLAIAASNLPEISETQTVRP
ncbi:MAG: hypothetical protein KAS93_01790 [Gammaproteobacteria bacterium]|nr:hypothetical protein [Gammaproteobacteria bacterium]